MTTLDWAEGDYKLLQASAHDLPMIPDSSVQAVITSPPYYGLRKYDGEQDIEWPTVEYAPMPGLPTVRVQGCEPGCQHEWVTSLTAGRSGGTASPKVQVKGEANFQIVPPVRQAYCRICGGWRGPLGLEPDPVAYVGHLILCLREWRRVLRDDGVLWLNLGDSYAGGGGFYPNAPSNRNGGSISSRQDAGSGAKPAGTTRNIIALKPKDLIGIPWRFAFAAQADGWYLRSDVIWAKPNPMPESVTDRPTKAHEYIFLLARGERYYYDMDAIREEHTTPLEQRTDRPETSRYKIGLRDDGKPLTVGGSGFTHHRHHPAGRNRRSVWTIATLPYAAAHFATWPPALVEPMVLASSRVGDVVLDPFSGSGTTGRVAIQHNRRYIGVDLSERYLTDLAPARLEVQRALLGVDA